MDPNPNQPRSRSSGALSESSFRPISPVSSVVEAPPLSALGVGPFILRRGKTPTREDGGLPVRDTYRI